MNWLRIQKKMLPEPNAENRGFFIFQTWNLAPIWSDFKGHPSNPRDLSIHPHRTWVGQGPATESGVWQKGKVPTGYWFFAGFVWSEIPSLKLT